MTLATVSIGHLTISRLLLGGNPFSGFSHQNSARNREMSDYYTVARIKDTMRQAEQLGINTFLGRADRHITRTLGEYWNDGGTIQWFAQTCPEMSSLGRSIQDAIAGGARAAYIHGGHMDNFLANGQLDQVAPALAQIRQAGLLAGVAGHRPEVFQWAEKNVDADFYMCSYYNPTDRSSNAEHPLGAEETFADEHRAGMVETIARLRKPVIHYKIFAAGRNDPAQAFAFVARHLRPSDAVCIGVFTKDNPTMLADDIALFQQAVAAARR